MDTITQQLAQEFRVEPQRIVITEIDTECGYVDFEIDGHKLWARLTKSGTRIRKNSIRGQN